MNDFIVSINSSKLKVKIVNESEIILNERENKYELITVSNHAFLLKLNNKVYEIFLDKLNNENVKVIIEGNYVDVTVRTLLQEKAYELLTSTDSFQHQHTEVKAPMPGLILKVGKTIGEKVELGDSVIILEAMKMENDIKSSATGTVESIFVTEGSAVEKGTVLFSIV